jgi:glucokinase
VNGFRAILWPATTLAVALIGAFTLLLVSGHQDQAQWAAVLLAQGAGFGVNLWITRRGEHKVEDVAEQVTGPSNEDLQAQLARLTAQLATVQQRLGLPDTR